MPDRPWTREEEILLWQRYGKWPAKAICDELNRSHASIRSRMNVLRKANGVPCKDEKVSGASEPFTDTELYGHLKKTSDGGLLDRMDRKLDRIIFLLSKK